MPSAGKAKRRDLIECGLLQPKRQKKTHGNIVNGELVHKNLPETPAGLPARDTKEGRRSVIGSDKQLDPDIAQCWCCFVSLRSITENRFGSRNDSGGTNDREARGFFYTIHEHPLLNFTVCSVCAERAEYVERHVLDIELNDEKKLLVDKSDKNTDSTDIISCSWCGRDEDELGDAELQMEDGGPNDLYLCDDCPRAFCTHCVAISNGGGRSALIAVRATAHSDGQWKCCACQPTPFLIQLQDYCQKVERQDNVQDGESTGDAYLSRLIEQLNEAEDGLDESQLRLEDTEMENMRYIIEKELKLKNFEDAHELSEAVNDELESYRKLWDQHHSRFADTIAYLQEELLSNNISLDAFYKLREAEKNADCDSLGADSSHDWIHSADAALNQRDAAEGFSKGEFRGASGYRSDNPKIYQLEPEDLNDTCIQEIEDINTTEGAIEQMKSNCDAHESMMNQWGSKMGTTIADIEMFEKRSIKFEKANLGDRLNIEELEKNCVREKDDIAADKSSVVSRGIGQKHARIVKRDKSLRSLKTEAKSISSLRAGLSGINEDRQPQLLVSEPKSTETPSKPKKRMCVRRVSNGGDVGTLNLLRPNLETTYEDSDVVLEVKDCPRKVSVCRALARLMKSHQIDGVKFCWKNICYEILRGNSAHQADSSVHGCILAHNMGLGKSFQVVCILHTLLTHPALVVPACNDAKPDKARSPKGPGDRLVARALLIAPVNTLANWQNEFEKWLGQNSGHNVPPVRLFCWDRLQVKEAIINEWYHHGGVLCCSSERYASACKAFANNDCNGSCSTTGSDTFLKKALFNPGPDIVVADEAHAMLKSNTSVIFKVLDSLNVKLRLALTGTPLQNNLLEYFRMANWVQPRCLGTENSFSHKYVQPIMDGMAADCSADEANAQEHMSNELHSILSTFVHRCGVEVLAKDIPFYQEAVIHVRQSKNQIKLYREFRKFQKVHKPNFLKQYHSLRPVSNHPACLIFSESENTDSNLSKSDVTEIDDPPDSKGVESNGPLDITKLQDQRPQVAPAKYAWICDICKKATFRTLDEAVDHESICNGVFNPASSPNVWQLRKDQLGGELDKTTPIHPVEEWWKPFAERMQKSETDVKAIDDGGKVVLLLQIIAHCEQIGDKVVVFSQCLKTLNYIEEILESPDWGGFRPYLPSGGGHKVGGWKKNNEYLRIDGSVDSKERGELIAAFNSSALKRSRVFLLSSQAGSLGINLVAANRVVLFDTHWNPTRDIQAVYRCYRYGQTKPTFCYRLLAEGSMEEKIYSRSVAKTSLSELVIDKRNPERSFTRREMDLLQQDDTWVQCDKCNKWRMLPPDVPGDYVESIPDKWFCEKNIYDKDRSNCSAKERNQQWYAAFWEARARPENEEGTEITPVDCTPKVDIRHQSYTERDVVLQNLIKRSEERKAVANGEMESSPSKRRAKSWISKYYFPKDKGSDGSSAESQVKSSDNLKGELIANDSAKRKMSKKTRSRADSPTKRMAKKKKNWLVDLTLDSDSD